MEEPQVLVKLLICGGGNGAHVLTGLASSRRNVQVNVMSLFADEAERFRNTLGDDYFTVDFKEKDGTTKTIKSRPNMITNDPSKAVPGCNLIIFTVPAFAHEGYFRAIAPYIEPNTVVVGLPSQPGFQFQCCDLLGIGGKSCAIVSFESLPWACRIQKFAREVQVLGPKDTLACAIIKRGCRPHFPILPTIQYVIGKEPKLTEASNYLSINLLADSVVHPPMMYGTWKDWDGKPVAEKPLFYQGLNDFAAGMLDRVSTELCQTAQAIHQKYPEMDMSDVIHLFDWYKLNYKESIADFSTLQTAMRTCKAYNGLVHPMKEVEGGKFVPDFNYRYMTEDLPFGMVVFRGIAQLAGVATPAMDETILWGQKILGKEYLVDGELKGKDMGSTRAPQRYHFNTLFDLVNLR
ncbi:opine dehydrogenase-like [Argonauta hians]